MSPLSLHLLFSAYQILMRLSFDICLWSSCNYSTLHSTAIATKLLVYVTVRTCTSKAKKMDICFIKPICLLLNHSFSSILRWPKPTRHPSKVIAGWCHGDSMLCAWPSIYLLPDSQHSLQLRHTYSWV